MKRWGVIIGTAAVAVWLVITLVRDFFANETIEYFSTKPARLLYVLAMAVCGGLAAWGFDRLSPRAQRSLRISGWGAAASTVTLFIGWLGFNLASLAPVVVQSGGGVWVLVAVLIFSAIAVCLWLGFYRALKRR